MATPVAHAAVLDGDSLIEASRNRAARRLGGRDRLASLLLGSLFAVTATGLALFAGSERPAEPWTICLLIGSYAIASRIDFEIGTGHFTVKAVSGSSPSVAGAANATRTMSRSIWTRPTTNSAPGS